MASTPETASEGLEGFALPAFMFVSIPGFGRGRGGQKSCPRLQAPCFRVA